MKIYLTSCETHENAWRHQEHLLTKLWGISSRIHSLTVSPSEADIIIVGNIRDEYEYLSLRKHPIICRYPTKCYAVDERDDWSMIPLLPGIFASAHKRLPFDKRYFSGSYGLYHDDFKNPYIEGRNLQAYAHKKKYLASFIGRKSHKVREALFDLKLEHDAILMTDTSSFNLFRHEGTGKLEHQEHYSSILVTSKFTICPRGAGASSIRLFEAMKSGVAPVIISDDWIVPQGPDWSSFAIFLKEREIDKLESVLRHHEPRYKEMGEKAEQAYFSHFASDKYFDYIVGQISVLQQRNHVMLQYAIWKFRNLLALYSRAKHALQRRLMKS